MVVREVPQSAAVHIDLDPAAVVAAYAAHRRRFAAEVADLDATQLAAASRCTRWSAADVLRHLCDVDSWMTAIWTGQPLPFDSFDPNVTPHEQVLLARDVPDDEIRDRYIATSAAMAADLEASDPERWGSPTISPLGFVPWWLSVLHVFWDSWLHERDVFLPLGSAPPIVADDTVPTFAYALALSGLSVAEPVDVNVLGVRVIAGSPPVTITPIDPPVDVADMTDALSGRGDLAEVTDPETASRFGGFARGLRGA